MNDAATFLPSILVAFAWFLVGLGGGLAFFRGLRMTVALFVGGNGWLAPVALTTARIIGVIALFSFAAYFGALALIACALGFTLARSLAVRTAPENG